MKKLKLSDVYDLIERDKIPIYVCSFCDEQVELEADSHPYPCIHCNEYAGVVEKLV